MEVRERGSFGEGMVLTKCQGSQRWQYSKSLIASLIPHQLTDWPSRLRLLKSSYAPLSPTQATYTNSIQFHHTVVLSFSDPCDKPAPAMSGQSFTAQTIPVFILLYPVERTSAKSEQHWSGCRISLYRSSQPASRKRWARWLVSLVGVCEFKPTWSQPNDLIIDTYWYLTY